ncbi:lipid-binding SYLF domain-containing protein [Shewanella sp. VB17]|uniref:lipid-binding SYLF domain-containing protein n=1 Tax=Shewanella sp. VB17 TaxID=2739432 RepID=UPI001563D44A|nr:lipid-binding SYLF domain-containing protein [Shewanella sp. VB17]NRD75635.1 lipid-binding SYLF domain-containing protein [Shewanella sp. VB17]
MTKRILAICLIIGFTFTQTVLADDIYPDTIAKFKQANDTHKFFDNAYGYAIFPTVGKGGFGIGAAYGKGKVFRDQDHTGNTSLTQLSLGFQIGGQAYSEIIFFKNAAAYEAFTSGSFEFNAQASAVAINIGANAQAGTTGNSSGAGDKMAKASYINGMAVYTMAKGGLMFEAALAGQSFTFEEN